MEPSVGKEWKITLCIGFSEMFPGATVCVIIEGLGVKPASSVEALTPQERDKFSGIV